MKNTKKIQQEKQTDEGQGINPHTINQRVVCTKFFEQQNLERADPIGMENKFVFTAMKLGLIQTIVATETDTVVVLYLLSAEKSVVV